MLDHLKSINNKLLVKYENNPQKFEIQLMISNFLKHNDCFFRISIEDAFNILKNLEIVNYKETYMNLISYDKYIE